jgi:NADH-quinone oxidoreductase subunit A
MPDSSAGAVLFVVAAAGAAVAFVGLVLGLNKLLSPRTPNAEKLSPYECGMPQAGDPHVAVRLRYATLAILFVIFDAESVLLFAVASRLKGAPAGILAVGAFALMLGGGLAYAWRKGALEWR